MQLSQIEAVSKTVIILYLWDRVATEIVAIDISEPNDLKIIWQSDREWSDYLAWNMKVMNETIFIMRTTAADDLTSIDLYDAKSGKHVEKFRHALFSNGCADLFGDFSSFEFWTQNMLN